MADDPQTPFSFTPPNLTVNFPITAQGHLPSQQLIANWNRVITTLSDGITGLADVLSGKTPFSGINIGGVNNQHLLSQNSNGQAISRPQGLANNTVLTKTVAPDQITLPVSVDTDCPQPAHSDITITNNSAMAVGDQFITGTETWIMNSTGDPFTIAIGFDDVHTVQNIANAFNAQSTQVEAIPDPSAINKCDLTTVQLGTGANGTALSYIAAGIGGAVVGAFIGGSATTTNAGGGNVTPIQAADIVIPVNGGQVQLNGRVSFTHNQTSTAIFTILVTRLSGPAGALPYSDQMATFLPGVGGLFVAYTTYFQDNLLNGTTGNAKYRFSIEVTNNSGIGYTATVNQMLQDARNVKR